MRGERRSLLGKTKLGGETDSACAENGKTRARKGKITLGKAKSAREMRNSRAAGKAPPFEFLPLLSTCPLGFLLPLGSPLLGFLHPLLLFSLTSSTSCIPATYWFSIPLLLPIGFLTTLFLIRDIAAFKATCASFQFSSAPAPFHPALCHKKKPKTFIHCPCKIEKF